MESDNIKYRSISYIDRLNNEKYKVDVSSPHSDIKVLSFEETVDKRGVVSKRTVFKKVDSEKSSYSTSDFALSNLLSIGVPLKEMQMQLGRDAMESNLIDQFEKLSSSIENDKNN